MPYGRFQAYNILGGVSWVTVFLWGGNLFGNIPLIKQNFGVVTILIVLISLLPDGRRRIATAHGDFLERCCAAQWHNGAMGDKVRGYAHRVDVLSDVGRVWNALVDPAFLTRWCSPKAEIRAQPGGLFRASVDRVTELEAHIDVFEPTRRIRLIYMATASLPSTDSVDYR